jgi:hypothetical protein
MYAASMRTIPGLLFFLCIAAAACASSSNGSTPAAVGACGLAFFPADYAPSCQEALDTACCSLEQVCAGHPDCVHLLACINACPAPRTDTCVNSCAGDAGDENTPGYADLNALGQCSKASPGTTPQGFSCSWPVAGP